MRGVVVLLVHLGVIAACSATPYGASSASSPDASAGDCTAQPGEIAFATLGQTQTVVLDWPNAPLLPAVTTRGPCPANTGTDSFPSRAYVLFNGTGAPAKPSAWGACNTSFDEINVLVYARSTPPVTAADLQGCSGYAGVGSTAKGTPGSPEDVGSGYCNGLSASDVGLTVPPCGRAVVLFQHDPKTFATHPPGPAGARMKLE